MKNKKLDNDIKLGIDIGAGVAVDDYETQIKIVIGSSIFIASTIGFICGYKAANAVNERIQNSILSYLKVFKN
jgi:hypothetical protein